MVKTSADIDAYFVREASTAKQLVSNKSDNMGVKKRKTDFVIEPSPLMRISTEVIEPNHENLEKAGLWEFIVAKWPMADPNKVLAYLLGSSRGAQEEFRIQGKIVHFDIQTIVKHFTLPVTGPTLVGVELLSKPELLQIFDKPGDAATEGGYSISKAKTCWKEWLRYVNQRLLMAPEGVEIITADGLSAAYRSWKGEKLNWTKILYNQIRMEIAGKATRNKLFFHSSTYLSAFCPKLEEDDSSVSKVASEKGESSQRKKRKYVSSSQEECGVDDAPLMQDTPMETPRQLSPDLQWISEKVMIPPPTPIVSYPLRIVAPDGEPLPTSPVSMTTRARVATPTGEQQAIEKRSLLTRTVDDQTESVKSRTETGNKNSQHSKSTATTKPKQQVEQEKLTWLKDKEALELLVTKKDDLVIQYQTSSEQILKAKDEVEKKLQQEISELVIDLKKSVESSEQWKKKCTDLMAKLQSNEVLKKEVSKLTKNLQEVTQKLQNSETLYTYEKEKGERLTKEMTFLIQQHAKQLHEAKFDNPITNLLTQQDAATIINLEQNVRKLAEANAKLQAQVALEQGQKLHLQEIVWWQELNAPPSFSLFRSYELQRDTFLKFNNLAQGATLTDEEFDRVWASAERYDNMRNLLCEMLVRGDLHLTTDAKLLVPIGDIGTRVLLYYLRLEAQLEFKRKIDHAVEAHRYIRLPENRLSMMNGVIDHEEIPHWRQSLENLNQELQQELNLEEILTYVRRREEVAQRGELSVAQYVYGRVLSQQRIQRSLENLTKQVTDIDDYCMQGHLLAPLADFRVPLGLNLTTIVTGSYLNQRFLGQYDHMFDHKEEVPFPTWRALEWLLEDYGVSRKVWRQWDKLYPRISASWSSMTPVAIATNPHACPLKCLRRYKWAPWAKLDTIPYNWPQIPGIFTNYQECAEAYKAFFETHRYHTDPVCYRAAVFCNFLAYVCQRYRLVINVNRYDESKPEFHIWMKLQQKPTRWIRLLECMAVTTFLNGPSSVFILEFSNTRQEQIDFWLNYQKSHDTYLLAHDEDVRRNLDHSERQYVLQEMEHEDEMKHKKFRGEPKRR